MNKWTILLAGFAGLMYLGACRPLDPCLKPDEVEAKIGDTIWIQSCDENAEIYHWQVGLDEVNTFLNPPQPFYNHYVDSGGGPCDPFVSIIFHDTGEFRLRCTIGKLSNGNCSDDLAMKKSETIKTIITIQDTL